MTWALTIAGGLACLAWVLASIHGVWVVRAMRSLRDDDSPAPASWPRLSVVVPACNEADTIEAAARTLLAQDYPNLEIVLINDRSTDGTGDIIDRLAAEDPRIVPVHVKQLPDGWLGKVHALARGTEKASGQWLLFTDADVHFTADALRRAVAGVEHHAIDMLSLLPEMHSNTFVQAAAVSAFGSMYVQRIRPGAVANPDSDAYAGVGAFNLVRREAFDRTDGWQWLRMEVADDVGLGLLLKSNKARCELWLGTGMVTVAWYDSYGDMVKGLEKNMFRAFGQFSYGLAFLRFLLMAYLIFGPLAMFASSLGTIAWLAPLLAYISVVPLAVTLHRRVGAPLWPSLLLPFGQVLIMIIVVYSTWSCWRQGGITWRGTHYSVHELRAEQRVKL